MPSLLMTLKVRLTEMVGVGGHEQALNKGRWPLLDIKPQFDQTILHTTIFCLRVVVVYLDPTVLCFAFLFQNIGPRDLLGCLHALSILRPFSPFFYYILVLGF